MTRTRIFLSYDDEHDADLSMRLLEHSRRPGSSFEIMASGRSERTQRAFGTDSRLEIRAADEVVVLCGELTHESVAVELELSIAQEEQKPYMLLWGRRERMCTKPKGALNTDAMYSWTREFLESQITTTLRNAKPIAVPENCKRHPR